MSFFRRTLLKKAHIFEISMNISWAHMIDDAAPHMRRNLILQNLPKIKHGDLSRADSTKTHDSTIPTEVVIEVRYHAVLSPF